MVASFNTLSFHLQITVIMYGLYLLSLYFLYIILSSLILLPFLPLFLIFFLSECDDRCYHHGECQGNGSCHCLPGWNGKFCTISGCPNNCFDRGLCKLTDKQSYSLDRDQPSVVARGQKIWKCFCNIGFTGDDCTTPTETECQDNEDNDNGKNFFHLLMLLIWKSEIFALYY